MLKKEIIVTKEAVGPVNYSHLPQQQYNHYQPRVVGVSKPYPNIQSQKDLDEWRKRTIYSVGSYVTLATALTDHNYRWNVQEIIGHAEDFGMLTYNEYGDRNPKVVWLRRVFSYDGEARPAARLDSVNGLRVLSKDEFDKYVKPHLAV